MGKNKQRMLHGTPIHTSAINNLLSKKVVGIFSDLSSCFCEMNWFIYGTRLCYLNNKSAKARTHRKQRQQKAAKFVRDGRWPSLATFRNKILTNNSNCCYLCSQQIFLNFVLFFIFFHYIVNYLFYTYRRLTSVTVLMSVPN